MIQIRQILNLATEGWLLEDVSIFDFHAPLQANFPDMRLTLDTEPDAEVLDHLFRFGAQNWSALEIIAFMLKHPEIQQINRHIKPKDPEEG